MRASLDLTDLFTVLERWRRLAVVQSDPAGFARLARRAAEKLTGAAPPEDEPLAGHARDDRHVITRHRPRPSSAGP
ncbi:MAG TPA: DUF6247 family protein [Actinomycetospora sp.]|nr:DUF6247 family protein [Actinomycetospora sp.]